MHCNTLKQDNDSTVRGDGGSRVGEVRAGTTSPMPEHKGFKLQYCKSTNFGVLLYLANLANCVSSLIFVAANIYVDRTLHRARQI